MEELRQTARAYYSGGCKSLKQSADEFFKSMDCNGDQQIRLHEYLAYMREEGYTYLNSRDVFSQLKKKKEVDYLDFSDVLTLFYIINSGRPLCDGCATLITGLFFTCPICFDSTSSFDVCPKCYHHGDYVHKHNDQFLDNFTLLQIKRRASLAAKWNKPQPEVINTTTSIVPMTSYYTHVTPSSSSLQLVLATPQPARKSKWKSTLAAIGSGLASGFISSGGCSIM